MKKKKNLQTIFKKKLHPFVGYAFLIGAGAIGITSASPLVVPKETAAIPITTVGHEISVPATTPNVTPNDSPADLASLKTSAAQFADQLKIIKTQIDQLNTLGRTPPAALTDAVGQGEQLAHVIAAAQKMSDIGETDPAGKLQAIGAAIAENAKF